MPKVRRAVVGIVVRVHSTVLLVLTFRSTLVVVLETHVHHATCHMPLV